MWSDALAQAGGAAADAPNPMLSTLFSLLPFLPLVVMGYFLILRPQQQQRKKQEELMKGLTKGDRVVTSSGLFGTVIGIEGEKAVLKIAENTKVEMLKSAIVQVVSE
jgi:preprotein translocase subunit YajC